MKKNNSSLLSLMILLVWLSLSCSDNRKDSANEKFSHYESIIKNCQRCDNQVIEKYFEIFKQLYKEKKIDALVRVKENKILFNDKQAYFIDKFCANKFSTENLWLLQYLIIYEYVISKDYGQLKFDLVAAKSELLNQASPNADSINYSVYLVCNNSNFPYLIDIENDTTLISSELINYFTYYRIDKHVTDTIKGYIRLPYNNDTLNLFFETPIKW